jgi:hypothetical protein
MRPKDCAYIVEHLSVRFMAMVADHLRQLTEHRAAFGARTEADAKIIAGLRSEIGAARMAVLERDSLMSERAKLQAMVKEQSDSAKAAGELLGWTANESPIQAVERVVRERDGLLTQVQDLVAERDALRAEVADLRGIFDMVHASLGIKRGDHIGNAMAALKAQTPKHSHPVKVGGWVKRLTPSPMTPAGGVAKVTDVFEVHGLAVKIERPDGLKGTWWAKCCEPCDPPNHDTEAGKAAAERTVRTEPVADEIKVWDVVEVYQATGKHTAQNDVGFIGTVGTIHLADRVAHVRSGLGMPHMVDLCDVRKVPQ